MTTTTAPNDGADLLDWIEAFLARFVAYPSEAARVAHVLWIAHTHGMSAWDSIPRIAFLSPEPGSGKSRVLEVSELLLPRPVHAVNTTPAYLFRQPLAELRRRVPSYPSPFGVLGGDKDGLLYQISAPSPSDGTDHQSDTWSEDVPPLQVSGTKQRGSAHERHDY